MGTYAMTGGATGIGAAVRKRLGEAGHRVVVVDLRDADIVADLSAADGRRAAIDGISQAAPEGLDGLITCAGIAGNAPDPTLIPGVNYFGSVELVEGLRPLLAARRGAVVLISSNSAPMETDERFVELLLSGDVDGARKRAAGMEGHPVYSGSKLAVARWMRRNAPDYAKQGVRLNAVAPGYTRTPMTIEGEKDPVYGDAIRDFLASIPIGRAGEPADIAAAVTFLLGPEASFVCGSVLFVDGGHDAMLRPDSF